MLLWDPERMDISEQIQRMTKLVRGFQQSEMERTGFAVPRQEKIGENLLQYIKQAFKKDGERLFVRACNGRREDNGFKMKEGRYRLDIRKKLFKQKKSFSLRLVRLPKEAVDVLSVQLFEGQVGWGSEKPDEVKVVA